MKQLANEQMASVSGGEPRGSDANGRRDDGTDISDCRAYAWASDRNGRVSEVSVAIEYRSYGYTLNISPDGSKDRVWGR